MKKTAVVYWSGTGHTQAMAEAVAKACGAQLFTAEEFSADQVAKYNAIAFGCPAMGAEVLEEAEFEPMFSSCKPKLGGKRVALFGSYGWGGQSIGQVEEGLKECKVEICLPMQKIMNTPNPKVLKELQNAVMGLKEA